MANVTLEMIETKEFGMEARGFNRKEVDAFLDDIYDTMEALLNENQKLKQQNVRVAPDQAPAATSASDQETASFREILEMAKKVKEETISKAQEDAQAILDRARQEANAQLAGLTQEKENLTRQVTELKKTATEYRAGFEALLQAQQDALERATDLF